MKAFIQRHTFLLLGVALAALGGAVMYAVHPLLFVLWCGVCPFIGMAAGMRDQERRKP